MAITGYNNNFAIDYDKPGFCALCHAEIYYFNGSDFKGNPILDGQKSNADKIFLKLDDGSSMGVSVCKSCKSTFGTEHAQELMESVQRGWQFEVETFLLKPAAGKKKAKWDQEKADAYYKVYRKRSIVDRKFAPWKKEDLHKVKKPRKKEQLLNRGK